MQPSFLKVHQRVSSSKKQKLFRADLIVFGSLVRELLERFVLGSISHSLALNAKCSVEIVCK